MITRRKFLQGLAITPALPYLGKLGASENIILDNPCRNIISPYIEVSARRSGKTTRLINDMIYYIENTGKSVNFTSGSTSMTHYIMELYVPKKYHKNINIMKNPKIWSLYKSIYRTYYDEVFMIESPLIQTDAYYTGTPQGTPPEWWPELMKFTNNKYEKYPTNIRNKKDYKKDLKYKEFKSEFLGEFV